MAKQTQSKTRRPRPAAGKADTSRSPERGDAAPAGGASSEVVKAQQRSAAELQPEAAPAPPPEAGPPLRFPVDELLDDPRAARVIVEVTGPKQGRRRAGRAFGAEPERVPLAELGADGLRAIDADPELGWAIVGMAEADDA